MGLRIMLKKTTVLTLFLLITFSNLSAQEFYQLDFEKSLEIAMDRSYQMRTLKQKLLEAEFELTAATNRFKTHVNLNFEFPMVGKQKLLK